MNYFLNISFSMTTIRRYFHQFSLLQSHLNYREIERLFLKRINKK